MSKGSNTTTSSNTPTALPAYQNAISQLQNVAATPYTPYGGELIAPVNQQQYAGIGGINQFATAAQPYLQTAAGYAQSAAQPLTQGQIQQYESPYTQDVVNATEAQFNNQNAQQQQQILGNAAAQGALGGDRTAVAQAVLAGQQQAQEAPVIAGLENQGYLTGLQTAQQQQQNLAQGAYNLGNVANSIQNAGLMGANAQVGAGTLEQQTQQAADQAAYQQFMQQQFMPESMLSWELPLLTGVGSQEGGTSTTTGPAPNPLGQYLGLGIAGLGAAGQAGGSAGIAGLLPLLGLSDRRAKENVRKIGKLNNGRDVYRFNYKGDPTTHIGLMAQDVEKDNPDAVHEVGGLKHVDYDEATKDAVRRFLGGRIQGLQSGGVPSGLGFSPGGNPWLTDAPMPLGPGAPPPPKLPGQVVQTPAQMAQNATGLANAMKKAFPTPQNSGDDVTTVGINSATGQFQSGPGINTGFMEYDNGVPTGILGVGPTDAGLTYGPGYRDGGLTLPRHNRIDLKRSMPVRAGLGMASFMPRRGFDAGGTADDDTVTFDDRWQKPPVPAGLYAANDTGTANPMENIAKFQTYGLNSPYAPSAADVPLPRARPAGADAMPADVADNTGAAPQTGLGAATAYMPEDIGSREAPLPAPPESVNAAPAQTEKQKGLFGLSPDFYTSLMAAGLGMMASRSPFLGTAIGEGGLQGINTYTGLKKQEQDVDLKVRQLNQAAKAEQDRIALESRKYNEMTPYEKQRLVQEQQKEEYQQSLPKTVQDPIFGQRTIVQRPDKSWVYVDTGEPVLPSDADKVQTPPPANPTPAAPGAAPTSQANPAAQPVSTGQTAATTDDPARPFKNAQPSSATMTKAMQMGLHGQAFLDAVPLPLRNTIESIGNYDEPETVFSKMGRAGIPQDRAIAFVRQFNPEYNSYWAQANRSSLREFLAGGPNSPAAQIRSYNTAIGHAGDAYDALQEMKTINPGFLQAAQNAGIPFVSYAAAQLQNRAIQGTPMGTALNKYVTAMTLYGAETSKLYSGSAGSQEEKNTIRAPLDPAKSIQEIEAGLGTSAHMMGSRANALEDQYKVAQNAPGLAQYGTKGEIKDFPVLHDRTRAILEKIGANQGGGGTRPMTPQDQQAVAWANAHPGDPRAAQIKQRLGVQ